ncbi:MAG TPA: sigma-70 family RNA polymerase sigma factor [Anaerolineales bacterium]|nr:sigma-70 family RNA polymerase sigma factor [Anaerolineales bacterium]
MDEQEAIRQLKHGDIGGLEFLVNLHQGKAVRTAYLITRDPALAEDVVQEAFLQAYRSIRHFDPTRPFGPWFMRSVVHAAVKAARGNSPDPQGETLEELFADEASVEELVETAEFQERLRAALGNLPPRQRAVIVQRYFLDMGEAEMAAGLETAPGTIKWLLHEARRRLHSLLSERNSR